MAASNEYHLVTRWRLPATRGELAEILSADPDPDPDPPGPTFPHNVRLFRSA